MEAAEQQGCVERPAVAAHAAAAAAGAAAPSRAAAAEAVARLNGGPEVRQVRAPPRQQARRERRHLLAHAAAAARAAAAAARAGSLQEALRARRSFRKPANQPRAAPADVAAALSREEGERGGEVVADLLAGGGAGVDHRQGGDCTERLSSHLHTRRRAHTQTNTWVERS